MLSLIEEKLGALRQLCAGYQVKQLELFGSATQERFEQGTSDLDFLVEFLPTSPVRRAECYFGLLKAFEELFGCCIDLTETSGLSNPYFLEAIAPTRRVLYGP